MLSISAFAQASGLSPKALRLYDDSRLLTPARVDPTSGYRSYLPDQLPRARRIALLRQAGMPLARIAQVLGAPDEPLDGPAAVAALQQWWREQERLAADRRGLVDYLQVSLLGEDVPEHEVVARDVPDRSLVTSTAHVTQTDLVPMMQRLRDGLRAHLDAAGADRGVEWWVVYHGAVTPDDDGPIEVCVPHEGDVAPTPEIALRVERAHREALTPLPAADCHYPVILHAFDAVVRWVERHGTAVGPTREVYPVPWDESAGAGPVVEIVQPFVPADDA